MSEEASGMSLWVCLNKDCTVTLFGPTAWCPTCSEPGSRVENSRVEKVNTE